MRFSAEQTDWYRVQAGHLAPLAARARAATIGIVYISETESHLVGSGLLLRIGDDRFVLTSAHVVDEFVERGNLQLLGARGTVHAVVSARVTQPLPGQDREDDPLDAAVLRLKPTCQDPPGSTYLSLADLGGWIGPRREVFVLGYPAKYTRVDRAVLRFDAEPLHYMSFTVPADRRITTPFDEQVNIAFDLEREKAVFLPGEQRHLPKLNGMSGGGVWSFDLKDGPDIYVNARLVGIFNEYQRVQRIGVATSVRAHLDIIGRAWPEMRPVMQLHGGGLRF